MLLTHESHRPHRPRRRSSLSPGGPVFANHGHVLSTRMASLPVSAVRSPAGAHGGRRLTHWQRRWDRTKRTWNRVTVGRRVAVGNAGARLVRTARRARSPARPWILPNGPIPPVARTNCVNSRRGSLAAGRGPVVGRVPRQRRYAAGGSSQPRLYAWMAAAVRLLVPSLPKIADRWFFTVFSRMPNFRPTCLLDSPSATKRRTSCSRSVSRLSE